ncbi:MAG: hypothetical protein IPL78_11595 [Chloroflexi bacterium]|nr:hypothetical protein [Chloroflexota bacterium]
MNQTGTANLVLFTLTGNTFNGHDTDNDAFRYQGINTTNGTIEIKGNTFTNSDGDFIQITLENAANLNITVGGWRRDKLLYQHRRIYSSSRWHHLFSRRWGGLDRPPRF